MQRIAKSLTQIHKEVPRPDPKTEGRPKPNRNRPLVGQTQSQNIQRHANQTRTNETSPRVQLQQGTTTQRGKDRPSRLTQVRVHSRRKTQEQDQRHRSHTPRTLTPHPSPPRRKDHSKRSPLIPTDQIREDPQPGRAVGKVVCSISLPVHIPKTRSFLDNSQPQPLEVETVTAVGSEQDQRKTHKGESQCEHQSPCQRTLSSRK